MIPCFQNQDHQLSTREFALEVRARIQLLSKPNFDQLCHNTTLEWTKMDILHTTLILACNNPWTFY